MATKTEEYLGIEDYKVVGTRPIRHDGADKVMGRAIYGADLKLPGLIWGAVLRSPHAHARIKSIDTSKAEALPGVKAVVTSADMAEMQPEWVAAGEVQINFLDLSNNILAGGKVLYDGHAVAAVAATNSAIANAALELIEVDYEVLPHVIDVEEAMAPDAPILHDDMFTQGVTPTPDKPSNVFKEVDIAVGDVEAGFAKADLIVERSFKTAAVHQGYIEPHAAVASFSEDGQAELWCCTQGHFTVRAYCAKLLGMDLSDLRVTASEIGGGFGGKTTVYLEPVALLLSRKAGRPVRAVMTREEVFRASGPTSGASTWAKIGVTKDGKIVAGEAILKYQAGAFASSPIQPGCMCAFAPYDIENVQAVGIDVVMNRPKSNAYRAPGSPIAAFSVESTLDDLAVELGIDPLELRSRNAAKEGTRAAYGPTFRKIGFVETLDAA